MSHGPSHSPIRLIRVASAAVSSVVSFACWEPVRKRVSCVDVKQQEISAASSFVPLPLTLQIKYIAVCLAAGALSQTPAHVLHKARRVSNGGWGGA